MYEVSLARVSWLNGTNCTERPTTDSRQVVGIVIAELVRIREIRFQKLMASQQLVQEGENREVREVGLRGVEEFPHLYAGYAGGHHVTLQSANCIEGANQRALQKYYY